MTENQWFRLLLVLVGAVLFAAGAVWGYSAYQARDWEREAQGMSRLANAGADRCLASNPSATNCFSTDSFYIKNAENYLSFAREHRERADVAIWFIWLPPLVLVFSFYALRWVIKGKIRPLWPGIYATEPRSPDGVRQTGNAVAPS